MKRFILGLFIIAAVALSFPHGSVEAVYVRGYYRSNGTYVQPYYRSRANAYTYDNYSYKSPTYSNGYGYNKSYPSGRSYNSNWYTPSYSDSDYNYGYNSYKYKYGY